MLLWESSRRCIAILNKTEFIDEVTFVYILYALCWSVVDNCLAKDSTVYIEEVDFFDLI